MVKLNNACLSCKQYSRPRMRSNRSPLVKCLTVSATKSCSKLYLITYNRKFSTCAARKESLDGALRHCNTRALFTYEFARGLIRQYSPAASYVDAKKFRTA